MGAREGQGILSEFHLNQKFLLLPSEVAGVQVIFFFFFNVRASSLEVRAFSGSFWLVRNKTTTGSLRGGMAFFKQLCLGLKLS